MKKQILRFFMKAILLVTLCVAPIILLNVFIDPYGIFRRDFTKQKIEPNQQFIKMRYLLKNPEKYDSYLFGSSRVGNIDVKKIRNGKYYNMTYSQSVPGEYLRNIKTMIGHGMKIKNLMVALDDFSYKFDPASHMNELIRYPYTDSPAQRASFYFKYLFKIPDMNILQPYLTKTPQQFPVFYDIYDSGRPLHPEIDAYINQNREKHIQDPKFKSPAVHNENRIRETLEEIGEIVKISKENNIRLTIFFNPIYKATYLANNPVQISEVKKDLSGITDFYDFSGINSVTRDPFNYYETSHYRVFVGDWMMARIFNYSDVDVPEDFGVPVTKENIDRHLSTLQKQIS